MCLGINDDLIKCPPVDRFNTVDKLVFKIILYVITILHFTTLLFSSITTTTTAATTIREPTSGAIAPSRSDNSDNKTGIKSMVDNEISRLKTDLNQLLQFNENLLHFDSSIVKNAAKTKVEKFMQKLSATIDRQLLNDETAEHAAEKLEAAANILRYANMNKSEYQAGVI